jgi:hypothetical protein
MVNPAVHIIGSGLWKLCGIIFKVYEYVQVQYLFSYLYML